MRTLRVRWVALTVVAVAACGGAKQAPPSAGAAQPVSPPPSASAAPASDMPTGAAAGTSDNVTKGIAVFQGGDWTAAKAYFDAALKKNPKDADALYYEGLTAEKTGDKDVAEKFYLRALKTRPDLDSASENLSALYDDAQRYDDAINVAKAAIARHSDDAALHANLGIAYAGKNDAADATGEFDQAVKLASGDASLRLTYAHSLAALKQSDAALQQLRAARPLAGDSAPLLAAIGHEMYLIKAFSDCVPTFDKAIGLKDAAEFRTERAACKHGAKDDAGALADLQTAVSSEPSYALAHYYLGLQLSLAGRWKEAGPEFNAYLKLAPNGPASKAATEKLRIAKQKGAK